VPIEADVSVLVVAGDAGLRETIRTALRATGFRFEEAGSGVQAIHLVVHGCYDLALVALGPDPMGGFDICRQLRAASPGLGIVLIRSGGTQEDEIRAIEAGAEDCVAMPFRFRAVVGRLGAVLRRPAISPAPDGAVLRTGELKLDLSQRTVRRANKRVDLTTREFDLLAALMKQRGNTMTHVRLLMEVWGVAVKHDPAYLRSYIKSLRKKIENDPIHPEYVITVPWVGYRFCASAKVTRR
jgi:two-component system KDP operon response regulator KdpE